MKILVEYWYVIIICIVFCWLIIMNRKIKKNRQEIRDLRLEVLKYVDDEIENLKK